MIDFAATITATGTVTFYGNAINTGTINGNVVFNNTSSNGDGGTINGDVLFAGCASNNGTINGTIIYSSRAPARNCPGYITSIPPFKADWVTSGRNRRLVIIPSKNWEQFQALNLPIVPLYGPWQPCPDGESCFAYPALYRPLAPFDFVMDYENNPDYVEAPGNSETETEEPAGSTLYYRPSGDARWNNLRNWSQTPQSTIYTPATALPTSQHSVVMMGACLQNDGPEPVVANLTYSQIGQSNGFGIAVTVTGLAKFINNGINLGTIRGNAEFRDGSRNAAAPGIGMPGGKIEGNATFSQAAANLGEVTGTASFADSSCNGETATAGQYIPDPPPTCNLN